MANTPLEVAGSVVLELGSVQMGAGSAGVLAGLYNGAVMQANCVAGFNVRQSGGQTLMFALIEGAETGSSFALAGWAQLHAAPARALRGNDAGAAGVLWTQRERGRGKVRRWAQSDAPAHVVLEARDEGRSFERPSVTVLYDGTLVVSPALVQVVAVNSLELAGERRFGAARPVPGSAWVQLTDPGTGMVRAGLIGDGE